MYVGMGMEISMIEGNGLDKRLASRLLTAMLNTNGLMEDDKVGKRTQEVCAS